jgi:hypothetical protein
VPCVPHDRMPRFQRASHNAALSLRLSSRLLTDMTPKARAEFP